MQWPQSGWVAAGFLTLFGASGCITGHPAIAHSFASTPRAISELRRGWADAVLGDYPVMAYMARESTGGTLEVVREQFEPSPFGIGVSKRAPQLRAAISDALRKIMADGTYMNILRQWAIHIGRMDPPALVGPVPAPSDVPQLKDGKLQVGMELKFAPMEFYDEFKHQAGADLQLAQALGKALGVPVEVVELDFDSLLPALDDGRVDVVVSAMTITPERSARADFVPYLMTGTGLLVKAGNPAKIRRLRDLCGRTVALQEGTAQLELVRSIKCD
ncbi:MAG TPA: transporter substrate-binding domain-containing protein [Polyangiales bacterium]